MGDIADGDVAHGVSRLSHSFSLVPGGVVECFNGGGGCVVADELGWGPQEFSFPFTALVLSAFSRAQRRC